MILIADSGGTKTDWTLLHSPSPYVKHDIVTTFKTQGITPIHMQPGEIRSILEKELIHQLAVFPRAALAQAGAFEQSFMENLKVFFYGSGCTPAHAPVMTRLLSEVLGSNKVEVYSDLMASARALCQHEEGIACILGTGANSCLYDGEKMVQNTPALGYILGDEGSGSVLGRLFMNAIFKNPQFVDVRDDYLAVTKLTQADIIEKVYRQPMANRFLASTSLYIAQHLDNRLLAELVISNFRQFFHSNIDAYQRKDLPVHFVGSMASTYQEQLHIAAQLEGYTIGNIMQSPMEGLIEYHR